MKIKIEKQDLIKIKNLCSVKDTVKRMRRHRLEEILTKDTSDEGLLYEIHNELLKFC